MKRVLHLISTDVFSGAENVACQIMKVFSNQENYKMVYCSVIGQNKQSLEERNIEVLPLEKFNYSSIKKAIREFKPDIIHAHDIRASIMATLFSKQAKVISHVHANHENMRKLTIKAILFKIISKRLSNIIWVSDTALEEYKFKEKVINKSVVLTNVIDANEIEERIKEDSNIYDYDIIYLGRITYQKNPIRFLSIIKRLTENNRKLKVAMIGSGELQENIKQMIREQHLENNIDLYGFVTNPYKILSSSKILLMTSRYEGTPMCALEAIACGLPIVTTITDGLKKIVIDGKTGFLADKDEILIQKIEELLSNKDKLEKMHQEVILYNEKVNDIFKYKKQVEKIYTGD